MLVFCNLHKHICFGAIRSLKPAVTQFKKCTVPTSAKPQAKEIVYAKLLNAQGNLPAGGEEAAGGASVDLLGGACANSSGIP